MKNYLKLTVIFLLLSVTSHSAKAQYYQIANQMTGMLSNAFSGSVNYKGFVDLSYEKGLGNRQVDFVGLSTSQGFKYRDWFFMGVGIGVDIAMSHTNSDFGPGYNSGYGDYWNHGYKTTGVMVPLFTDFRFNLGNKAHTSFFIDAKIGASFLMGNNYLAVADGFITNREYFYLKPSAGVRIPLGSNRKSAVNIGVTYQLLTSNYWYNSPSSYNVTLSSLGATVGFEW